MNTAKFWTETYAQAKETTDDTKVDNLVNMGFDKSKAADALKMHNGDENAALEELLSGA